MLSISEIKIGKLIQVAGEPYAVIKADHHKMGRGGAVLKVKLRNLVSGSILEKTFQGNERAEEARVEKKKANFLYKDDSAAHFMDNENFEQFDLPLASLGEKRKFLKDGLEVEVLYFENSPVAVELPIKIALKVVSAPPGVKGNSAGNVTKTAELETGLEVNVPMFVEAGDMVKVNTDTGEYVERA